MPAGDIDFEMVRRHLAANVARLRARRRWSQQQTADAAGLDLKHVQKLEYGALNPSLRTLVRLARAFEVTVGKLLAPTKARPPKRPVGRPRTA
jgi:transcriptional regulator with XRE-family HTH domain